jgi:hypothetical protein
VFARTIEDIEGRGAGEQFRQVATLDVDDAEFGEVEGTLNFSGEPLHTGRGTYGPIEWTVRAVSINGVESAFSDTLAIGDNVAPLVSGSPQTAFSAGDSELTFTVDEPLDEGTVEPGNVTLNDSNGDERLVDGNPIVDAVEVANSTGTTEVTVTLVDGEQFNSGDRIVVGSGVNDLAGNDFDGAENIVEVN